MATNRNAVSNQKDVASKIERSYHPIKDINKKKETWKLAVIIDELWSSYKGDKEDLIEMLLRDINGSTIQATILTNDIATWKGKICKGKIYYMHNFRVGENDHHFKMSDHNYKLTFNGATRLHDMDLPGIPMPLFKFKNFSEILEGKYRPDLLVDAIGVVHHIGKSVTATSTRKANVAFKLMDLSEKVLDCTLWDDLSVEFLEKYNNRADVGPFVLIINHARIKEAQGNYPLQLSNVWNGTRLLFDDNIKEIQSFKASLPKDAVYATQSYTQSYSTQCYTQGSVGSQNNPDDVLMKNARVMRLADIKLLKKDTICVTVVQTGHIRTSGGGWFFRGCRDCNKKAEGNQPPFICANNHETDEPLIKYKVDVEVVDGKETAKFVFWDNTMDDLVGMTAAQLLKKMNDVGINDSTFYPDEIEELMERTFAFRVKWQYSWGQATVIMCKDDKDLVAKIVDQMPNAETTSIEAVPLTPTNKITVVIQEPQPTQVFTTEDIAKFQSLDDSIMSSPNFSASAETDPAYPHKKTPAKQVIKQKSSVTPTDKIPVVIHEPQPKQVFTTEDIAKFQSLDDSIISSPNFSACAETDPAFPDKKTPAKRVIKQKSSASPVEVQQSSSRGRKIIKKEK